jgi:hypothetical protein
MGYYITKLKDTELNEYIGSQTMYSCADNGAFNGDASKELEDYADENENVMAVVDKSGVDNFLMVLKQGNCRGRDVQKFAKAIEENYRDGFMMRG